MKEFIYNLEAPFEYAYKGDTRTAEFVTLLAPTMKNNNFAASLTQSVRKSILAVTRNMVVDKDAVPDDSPLTGEAIMTLLFSNPDVDINVIFEQAKALFKNGGALVDGEEKMTTPLIEKMEVGDFQNMVGEYIVNFTIA